MEGQHVCQCGAPLVGPELVLKGKGRGDNGQSPIHGGEPEQFRTELKWVVGGKNMPVSTMSDFIATLTGTQALTRAMGFPEK